MWKNDFKLMITCEHACNDLPGSAEELDIPEEWLCTHLGYDIGALNVYRALVKKFKPDFYAAGKYSRLYIDLNRSLSNCKGACSAAEEYYKKYWNAVEKFVAQNLHETTLGEVCGDASKTQILHLAIHSFTPILDGRTRNADIGILYDPSRPAECKIADIIVAEIRVRFPQYKVRRNYPYQGKTDGLCTALRKKFDPNKTGCYVGFEIEINQKLL